MSEQYTMTGTVKTVMDLQTFDSGFCKREFVITTADQYPQEIKFEVTKDRVNMLDNIQQGQTVKVAFNVRGNEYQGRYYVNLQAWRIEADTTPKADTSGPTGKPESEEEIMPF